MRTAGERIKWARKMRKITQKEIVEKVGITQPVLSQLENGINGNSKHIPRIAEVLGVDPIWLSTGSGSAFTASTLSIQSLYDRLDEDDQKTVLAILQKLQPKH